MLALSSIRCFHLSVVAAMLAGCVTQVAPAPLAPSIAFPSTTRADRLRSWVLPEAKQQTLLYVSTQNYGIYVFEYPNGKLVGILYAAASAEGLCADSAGDVFINDSVGHAVIEYAHGGDTPIRRLTKDDQFSPYDCAVDSVTGNLAATNLDSPAVLIFKKARTYLRTIFDPGSIMWYCAYDPYGNLFTDRHNRRHNTFIGELPRGAKKFKNLKLNKYVLALSGMRWYGKYLAVGDLESDSVYKLRVSSSNAAIVGTTHLVTAPNVWQFWIYQSKILNPETSSGVVGIWRYPRGGVPLRTIEYIPEPDGVAISQP